MPRPKKQLQEARSVVFGLRLTADERVAFEAAAAALGVSPTDYARAAVLGGRVDAAPAPRSPSWPPSGGTPSDAPAGIAHIVALNRVGVNLNQIARALNTNTGFVPAELEDALQRVSNLLDDWRGMRA